MIMSGNLKKLIDEDGIRGVTSNPQIFKDAIAEGEEYEDDIRLVQQGARPQRVLWASTSTKNPDYSDIKYVEALIGAETIPVEPENRYKPKPKG